MINLPSNLIFKIYLNLVFKTNLNNINLNILQLIIYTIYF